MRVAIVTESYSDAGHLYGKIKAWYGDQIVDSCYRPYAQITMKNDLELWIRPYYHTETWRGWRFDRIFVDKDVQLTPEARDILQSLII